MPVLKYEDATDTELQRLDRKKSVVLLSVNALTQNGRGSSDLFAAKIINYLSDKRKEWNFIILPPLFLPTKLRPIVLRAFVYAYCKKLAKEGFKNVIATSERADPRWLVILEEIATKMQWRYHVRMVSSSSHFLTRAQEGVSSMQVLTNETLPLLDQFLDGADVKKLFRSKFYYIPYFRTDFKWILIILIYTITFGIVWWWLMHLTEVYR